MRDGAKLLIFLLLLPFVAAISYDIYANYFVDPKPKLRLEALEIDPSAFQASDLGYIVVTYARDYYDLAKAHTGPEIWEKLVDPVLRLYSFVVALVPPLLFFVWLLIARIFDIWPFSRGASSVSSLQSRADNDGRQSGTRVKYKRR